MHRLSSVLGMPQHRFDSIHVVGTNGKSSVALMVAALLEAHGVESGASISPHLRRWSERVRVRGDEIEPERFASAVERAAEGAAAVDRTLREGERVTQFEVATAAAFVALAAARVRAAAIEAGLGGRLDATNVIASQVTVLTSVGLDHTQWLGDTELEIAGEKLAVLREGSCLVLGRTSQPVAALAEEIARQRGARLVRAADDPGADVELRAPGPFQRRNFALAVAAAGAYLGAVDPDRVRSVAAEVTIPGRLEVLPGDPPTIVDAAHNPDGAAALAEALPELAGGRPVVACLGILAEKDAAAMVAALAPAVAEFVCTELPAEMLAGSGRPDVRAWGAAELAGLCAAAGVQASTAVDPRTALAGARERAREVGGIALLTGSHYLLGAARAELAAQ
jgi:dihydrofolate synthase / folylpolyglutamate synthase